MIDVVGLLGGRPVGSAAEAALRGAVLVVGGRDQLAGVADLLAPGVRTAAVGAGLGALDDAAASPGPACVLASGDPGCFGILRPLAARVGAERLAVHPAPSSVALAFARLGLASDDAVVRSCHRGGAARVAAEVTGAAVAAVLCGPEAPPEAVGAALVALGASHRLVAVATRLGEPGEQVTRCTGAASLAAGRFDARSVVVLAHPQPAAAAGLGGRPVADFAHRASMITKPEVRSVVLGKLCLPERGVLWDVGAGSGSVAIEAALAAPGLRVIAVERSADDVARVLANAAILGAIIEVVEGSAPGVLAGLPAPDRVFVGGGGLDVVDACHAALRPGGRLVATFAAVDRAAQAHRRLGSLVQVAVATAEVLPDGGLRLVADNPVFVAWGDRPTSVAARPAGRLAVGIGCSSAATTEEIAAVVEEALALAADANGLAPSFAVDPAPEAFFGGGTGPGGTARALAEPWGALGSPAAPGPRPAGAGDGRKAAAGPDDGNAPERSVDAVGGTAAEARWAAASASAAGPAGAADLTRAAAHPDSEAVTTEVPRPGRIIGSPAAWATIDLRRRHPAVVAVAGDGPLLAFPACILEAVEVPNPSALVASAVGTPSVAEAAALLAAGPGARLVVSKRRGPAPTELPDVTGSAAPGRTGATATAAVAVGQARAVAGRVQIVGLGPGHPSHRTPAAVAAVRGADAVLGYGPYVDAVASLLRPEQLVLRSAMGNEAERAIVALALARAGWQVALVSSGDPGIFAMASVTLELAGELAGDARVAAAGSPDRPFAAPTFTVEVVPGVTAASAAASVAGAPLAGPHAVLTLSDLLLPWATIEGQLRAAAASGLAIALYNPRSVGRPDHLAQARAVLVEVLDPATPVAVVTAATDAAEHVVHTTLGDLDTTVAGMRSLVLIGTTDSLLTGGRLVTRRHHPRPEDAR